MLPRVICFSVIAAGCCIAFTAAEPTPPAAPAHDLLLEAEEFEVVKGPWKVIGLGENYYAATLSNTFISRQKLLSAPEECDEAVAVRTAPIPADGKYRAWTRYECPSRFAVEHTLRIEQSGKVVFERLYGATTNPKLWPFGKGITPMAEFDWGSGDNVVWEPSPEPIALSKGPAKFTLLAAKQKSADMKKGGNAKRNIDCVYLTSDTEFGIKDANKQSWHVLDRVLNQAGECYLRVTNPADAAWPLSVDVAVKAHNPYWQPRGPVPPAVCMTGGQAPAKDADWIAPGKSSPWVPIGQALDTTNMQELILTAKLNTGAVKKNPAGAHFVVELARDPEGKKPLRTVTFKHDEAASLILEMPHDLRGPKPVIRTLEEWHEDLLTYLRDLPPSRGKTPEQVPVMGIMGGAWHGRQTTKPDHFYDLRTETGLLLGRNTWEKGSVPDALAKKFKVEYRKNLEIDVRGIATKDLEKYLQDRKAKSELDQVLIVSMGDEIGVGGFDPKNEEDNKQFREYLKKNTNDVDADKARLTTDPKGDNKLYYWSQMFSTDRGIAQLKERTDIVEKVLGKGVYTGANYSPHPNYWPKAGQWVRLFRQRAMTMPWSEDWTFQVPEPNMMVSGYLCDVLRCAGRDHDMPIQFYTMPHSPGQTPRDLTLSFYSALAHGNKVINFFAGVPIYDYTENWVAWEARDTWKAIRDLTHDVGQADDIIWKGKVRPSHVAFVISHTTDIWEEARGSSIYNFERKNLYYLLRRMQIPVDFVTEEDVADGKVKDYKALMLCGDHLLRSAAEALRDWVAKGGYLFSVAGGGLLDEYDQPLDTLKEVFGIKEAKLTLAERNCFAKEGLAWLDPLDRVTWLPEGQIRAFAAKQELTPTAENDVVARFSDKKAAMVRHIYKNGIAILCGFFPGTAFVHPAIPKRAYDRGTSDDNFNHFLPDRFQVEIAKIAHRIDTRVRSDWLPVLILKWGHDPADVYPADNILDTTYWVDATLIESPDGAVVPIANYSGKDFKEIEVLVQTSQEYSKVYAVRAGEVKVEGKGKSRRITLPLGWADMIVFRK